MAQKDMSQVCQPQIGECLEGGVETQKGETVKESRYCMGFKTEPLTQDECTWAEDARTTG